MRWRTFQYRYLRFHAFTRRAAFAQPVRYRRGRGIALGGLAGVALAALSIHLINAQLRPIMAELAAAQVRNAVTLVIDHVVSRQVTEGNITYDDIIKLEIDDSGKITALKNDMTQVNLIRADILNALVAEVNQVDTKNLSIPLGNLTGADLFSGRGPNIPVRVLTAGTAEAIFQNVFSDAGINQTRHQIMLDITVPVSILMPGYTASTVVTGQVCVAETVIVGQVPDTYLQFGGTTS